MLDVTRVPWYDSIGNLVVMTRENGVILERYDYSPFGDRQIRVDLDPPKVERLQVEPTLVELILSEEVSLDELEKALANGDVQATEDATGDPVTIDLEGFDASQGLFSVSAASGGEDDGGLTPITAGQTVSSESRGNPLRRRVLFTVTDPPAAGTLVTLAIASSALVDSFNNPLAAPYTATFAWPSAKTVVDDTVPPRVESVVLVDGHLEVTFNEDVDSSTVPSAFDVGDPSVGWEASPDGYTYRSDQPLAVGDHELTIESDLLVDVGGVSLSGDYYLAFEVTAAGIDLVLYKDPDPTLVSESAIGNRFGFHGLHRDAETGLYYARHRYYDVDLGRFLSSDPLGYADGPNTYQYALNNPVNFSDPMGLETHVDFFGFEFTVSDEMEDYIAEKAGEVVGTGLEFYDRYKGFKEAADHPVGPGAAFVEAFYLRTRFELERHQEHMVDAGEALVRGDKDAFWAEYHEMLGEQWDNLIEELRHAPIGQTVDAVVQARAQDDPFQRGVWRGRGGVRATEDVLLLLGFAEARAVRAPRVPRVPRVAPRVHMGKQGKHIPGHNNYLPGRSRLTYPEPQALLDRFAGSGQQVGSVERGTAGFKERVNFGVVIGDYVNEAAGVSTPTMNGIIIYAQDGTAHIVPVRP